MPELGTIALPAPNFFDSVGVVWRRKLLLLLVILVAVGATWAIDSTRTKQYQSTASLYFQAQGASSSNGTASLSPGQLATDVQLVQSAPVKQAAHETLRAPAPPVSVALVGNTQVADLTVTSTNPNFAARAANAYAAAYISQVRKQFVANQLASETAVQNQIDALQTTINRVLAQVTRSPVQNPTLQAQLNGLYQQQSALNTQLGQLQLVTSQSSNGGQLVSPAVPSKTPSAPKTVRDLGIAAVTGLVVGIGFALLLESFDDTVHSKSQLEQLIAGIPVLGLIPVIIGWRDTKVPYLASEAQPRAAPAEAYRGLRTSVQFLSLEKPIRVLQITSPAAGDGKTTTSANVAWAMAEAGQRVILVSCDLRRPRIHEFFGLPNEVGFTSVLLGMADIEHCLLSVPDHPNLRLLASGPIPPNPSELLSGVGARNAFASLRNLSDIVIIDSAPMLPVTDGAVLSNHADAVLLVATSGQSRRRDVTRSIEVLRQINAPIVGAVLNQANEADSYAYYRNGYGYGYGYANGPAKAKGGGRGKVRGVPSHAIANGHAPPPSDETPTHGIERGDGHQTPSGFSGETGTADQL